MNDHCKKASFSTEQQAEVFIDKIKRTGRQDRLPQRSYLCHQCLNWHLTSKEDFNKNNIKELQQLRENITSLSKTNDKLLRVIKGLRQSNLSLYNNIHYNMMKNRVYE